MTTQPAHIENAVKGWGDLYIMLTWIWAEWVRIVTQFYQSFADGNGFQVSQEAMEIRTVCSVVASPN